MNVFEQAFRVVVGEEGGFTDNPADPGNWTGGACGSGLCRGTKYGIAASSHPDLDIASLDLAQARALYRAEHWDKLRADEMPAPLALLVFDASVNCGPARAGRWLQTALGVASDGLVGPATIAAIAAHSGGAALMAEIQALRLAWMTTLPTWRSFGLGWARRLCRLPYNAMSMEPA